MKNNGQMAIWVIIGVVIVVGIVSLTLFLKGPSLTAKDNFTPESYMELCARDSITTALDKIILQGGFVNPASYKSYNGVKSTYLCQNQGYFFGCVNQHPILIREIQNEIVGQTKTQVGNCFNQLESELKKRNMQVEMGEMNITAQLAPDKVFYKINREMKITNKGDTRRLSEIKLEVISPVYNMANVAIDIVNQEAKYCYYEYVGFMLLYPRYEINKFAFSEGTKIYTLTDLKTSKEMNFAVRGCVMPAGLAVP
ncbi:MAG: hypothetical protein WCK90_00390 [archaeon]